MILYNISSLATWATDTVGRVEYVIRGLYVANQLWGGCSGLLLPYSVPEACKESGSSECHKDRTLGCYSGHFATAGFLNFQSSYFPSAGMLSLTLTV